MSKVKLFAEWFFDWYILPIWEAFQPKKDNEDKDDK